MRISDWSSDVFSSDLVMLNLLSNAIKFTGAGGSVSVVAALSDKGLQIRVRDTGIGIAEADRERAFEPFGQVDSSLARSFEGTGLGLPIARALMALPGGSLSLERAVGIGPTVTMTLPMSFTLEVAPDRAPGARRQLRPPPPQRGH